MLALSPDQLTAFDLDAFIAHAHALNQQNRITFTTPFPKALSRWLSHYEFTPDPLEFTSQGDVDGDLSWLVGVTLDFSFTRSLCAPSYGSRGGSCYDPASLVVLEVAAKVDQYVDYAQFCRDLHDSDKGRRSRQLAGLHGTVPGEDDLRNFRYRIGDAVIDQITTVVVDFLRRFGLIKGELLSTDGQLESSYSRYKGCIYACPDCQAFTLSEADRQTLLATCISKPPTSTWSWLWNCQLATPPTRPMPMRAPGLSRIGANSLSHYGRGRCTWGTRPMTSPPTTSGFMSMALSPSLTITGATSTSMRPPC